MPSAVDENPAAPSSGAAMGDGPVERHAAWFRLEYPRVVGLIRHVLDQQHTTDASVHAASGIAEDAFGRIRRPGSPPSEDHSDRTAVICRSLDQCLDRLSGHPGTVPLHYELLGPDIDFDGDLPLAELHDALSGLRRGDRRAGLLGFAAGASPSEVASLLDRPLDETLERLGRVATRLADGRRVGLVDAHGIDLT